jgi:hypothetical protein
VVGAPSSSELGRHPDRRAAYHLYRIVPAAPEAGRLRCAVSLDIRRFDASSGRFVAAASQAL